MRSLGLLAALSLLAACSGSTPTQTPDAGNPGPAPDTAITSGPPGMSNRSAVAFEFSSTIAGSSFLCTVDQNATQPCVSPLHLGLTDGAHHFAVAAKSPAGAVDASPATADWTIDTTPPETVIDSVPDGTSASATFTFHSNESGATFQCALDGAAATSCSSGVTYDGLSIGDHTFSVAATDLVGNVDASPATTAWTVTANAVRLRLMAANLSSGTKQSYDDPTDDTCYTTTGYGTGEGVRIFQGLKPDVVMLQEFHYFGCDGADSDADVRHFVDLAFGTGYSYYREPVGGPINLPNGIISRYPIIASGQFADTSGTTQLNRSYVWARIDIPGTHDLWVVSLHLKASSGSTNATRRDAEAQQIDQDVQSLNIPAGDYLAIGGDFNTYSRTEPCLTTFQQIVDDADDLNTSASPPLYSVDQADDGDTNSGRSSPYDWVLANSALKSLMTAVTFPSGNSFAHGLVFDSRVYTPLSDVSPVLATDSAATYPDGGSTNMQHMGVVRDFLVPN